MSFLILGAVLGLAPLVASHAAIFHPSMYGFNVTAQTFPYDNRPVAPLQDMTFDQWWFHGHLDYPPNPGDIFELPAGKTATTEIACDKGATTWFNSSQGGDIRQGDNVCPGQPTKEFHANNFEDVRGCALAIAYKNDAKDVQPEDFTVFSVNQTCVWTRFTDFQVPERMPPCPEGGCTCAFFWIHAPDSGSEQNYMNGFKCNITGSTSNVALAESKVPRRCGADLLGHRLFSAPANCTYGAKQPFYWDQTEKNTMFEDVQAPPFYNDLYNFADGAQNDIFVDSYDSIPDPTPVAALPLLANLTIPGVPIIILKQGNATINDTTSNVDLLSSTSISANTSTRQPCHSKANSTNNARSVLASRSEGWKRSRIAAHWHRRQLRALRREEGSLNLDTGSRRRSNWPLFGRSDG